MTPEQLELATRLVALPKFRWTPGMRAWKNGHGSWVTRDLRGELYVSMGPAAWQRECLPNLADPATRGCVLALVREAWDDPGFYVAQSNIRIKGTDRLGWDFFGNLRGKSSKGMLYRSEEAAMVDALEAAGE